MKYNRNYRNLKWVVDKEGIPSTLKIVGTEHSITYMSTV